MKTLDALRTIEASTLDQRGLLSTAQAQRLGIDRTTLNRLTSAGDLEPIRRGIYAHISSLNDPKRELRAAWLQTAPQLFAHERLDSADTPVIAYASAASVHEIGNLLPSRHTFITQTRKQTRHPDLRFIQKKLHKNSTTIVDNMLTTSVKQTIHDLAMNSLDSEHLAQIVQDSMRASLLTQASLQEALTKVAAPYGYPNAKSFAASLTDSQQITINSVQTAVSKLTECQRTLRENLEAATKVHEQLQAAAESAIPPNIIDTIEKILLSIKSAAQINIPTLDLEQLTVPYLPQEGDQHADDQRPPCSITERENQS